LPSPSRRPRLWRRLPRSRDVPQLREIGSEVVMAQKLFIGGLAFSTSDARLREVFGQAGVVESAAVVMDRETGRSRGFGFVEMATAQEADAAVKKFNGQELDGRTLKVEIAKPSGLGGGARNSGFGRSRW
jgi:cold-inducible RNA-binding protein